MTVALKENERLFGDSALGMVRLLVPEMGALVVTQMLTCKTHFPICTFPGDTRPGQTSCALFYPFFCGSA